jgi:hypothetical protein
MTPPIGGINLIKQLLNDIIFYLLNDIIFYSSMFFYHMYDKLFNPYGIILFYWLRSLFRKSKLAYLPHKDPDLRNRFIVLEHVKQYYHLYENVDDEFPTVRCEFLTGLTYEFYFNLILAAPILL